MGVIIEPFKIKTVEAIPFTTEEQRRLLLREASYNLFLLPSATITFDFLTDSGTSAMSDVQWAAMMRADESYAGSSSYWRFEKVVRELTGYRHVIPTHQGRAAERILFSCALKPGQHIPNNNHFDTTRANIEYQGGIGDDLVIAENHEPQSQYPFKGNIDLVRLENYLEENRGNVALGMVTITNNTGGGQPASLENIRGASALYRKYGVPFFLDACRFAENAYMIQQREPGQADRSVREIAHEVFSLADGCTMSGKKDGIVNMGGFLAVNDDALATDARNLLILTEGFPTYGGQAARDLEAFAVGLDEVLDQRYLDYRMASTKYLKDGLNRIGIPTMQPAGGHAVYIDASAFLPHVPARQFPGQSVAVAMYLEGGIRTCEIGSVMFGKPTDDGGFDAADLELVRIAIPRRRYTQSHIDYVIEVCERIVTKREQIGGMEMTERPPFLPHFTAKFAPLDNWIAPLYKAAPA
jgi:tyrosine phenol-lyase